jgi:Lantibiotic dehydratase, N terminus
MCSVRTSDQILDLETENAHAASAAIVLLEGRIGLMPSQSAVRKELIQLKRDVFNDRLPRTPLSEAACSELERGFTSAECSLVLRWIETRRHRETLAATGESVLAEELSAKSARLRSMSRRPAFRSALQLASPALSDDLRGYIECPARFSAGQTSRIERSLIRYYTRSAVKLSPFSSFMRSRILRIGRDEVSSDGIARRPVFRRCVRINRSIPGQLAQRIAQHPELRQFVPVSASGAAVRHGNRILVLRQRYDASRATRLRIPAESLADLEYTDAVATVMDRLEPGQSVPFGALVATLAPVLGGPAAASEFICKLVDIGLLLHKIPLPQDDSCTLGALRQYLEDIPSPDFRLPRLARELERLQALEMEFQRAASNLRPELVRAIEGAVESAHHAIEDVPVPKWAGRTISEDVIEEPAGRMPLPARWLPVVDDLRSFLETYVPLLDIFSSLRASMRELLMKEFGGGPVPFLRFAARYRQAIPVVRDPKNIASLRNPFRLETLAELEKMRDEVGSLITLPADSTELDLRAAAQEARWPQRLRELGLPGPIGGAAALTCFIQPYLFSDGAGGLVVNQIDAGPCRAVSRVLAASGEQPRKSEVLAELSQALSHLWKAAEPCTIYATFDYNLNSGPAMTERVIDYAGDAIYGDKSIPLGSLTIAVTAEGGLRLSTGDRAVAPVHFGAMSSAFQPLIPALLLAMGRSEPILVRPFDPRNWGPMPATLPDVARFPRLVFGRCIARRRGWLIRKAALPKRTRGEQAFTYFSRVRKWQRELELPDEVFVRVRALGERGDQDGMDARSSGLPHKPQYLDFRNYFLVESLDDLLKDVLTAAYFEEALPSLEDWAPLDLGRAIELAVDACIDAGAAGQDACCTNHGV